jgi:hypothetical protein
MSRRTAWIAGFLAWFVAWIGLELLGAFDSRAWTVPLTDIIVASVPMKYGFPAIVAFAVWLVAHFWIYWRRRRRAETPTVPGRYVMFARIRKAVLAGLGATVAALVTAFVQSGRAPGAPEIGAAVGTGVLAGWLVWRVPNATPAPPAGVSGTYGGRIEG